MPLTKEEVILVDEQDQPAGSMEKMEAHRLGKLHRAFSVFILNGDGKIWLQKRAEGKYHSGGLWSNSCCGHPRPGEEVKNAAERRLFEESGLKVKLQHLFSFHYFADVGNGFFENELDHVFFGKSEREPALNKDEVSAWELKSEAGIRLMLRTDSTLFSAWFGEAFTRFVDHPEVKKHLTCT